MIPRTIEVSGERAILAAFTDLDGTVNNEALPEAERLSSTGPAREGLRLLQERYGIPVGPITARSEGEARAYARHLGIVGPAICEDGAVVLLSDERAVVLSAVDTASIGAFLEAVEAQVARLDPGSPPLVSTIVSDPALLQKGFGHATVEAARLSARRLASGYIVNPTDLQRATMREMLAAWGMRTFSDQLPHIVGADVSKGVALTRVCNEDVSSFFGECEGIRRVVPIVFGNADHDIDLFRHADRLGGVGVIVGRAEPNPGFAVDESVIPSYVIKAREPFGHGILASIPHVLQRLSERYGAKFDS